MKLQRASGVLLHPTSLSGPDGIGTLGDEARRFIRRLAEAGQRWWQILPLHPPGHGGSPYSAPSAFALNPMLIDLVPLVEAGWLTQKSVDIFHQQMATLDASVYAIDQVAHQKGALIDQAFKAWQAIGEGSAENNHLEKSHLNEPRSDKSSGRKNKLKHVDFDHFIAAAADWLPEYALFSALKEKYGQKSWTEWPEALVRRDPAALNEARKFLAQEIERVAFAQWLVDSQWRELREYARAHGVKFIGDIPIFVAMDSADAWAHRDIFQLDQAGRAREVSGVPPDYFSAHGQKWGNPLYDWHAIARSGYAWWLERVRHALNSVDIIRIDHFRAFEDYWAVPAEADTAIDGRWRDGPRDAFFAAVEREFGEVPFIAEDLGMITPQVVELRQRQHLPGMKVLQFADFNDPEHIFLPPNYAENFVAYTGTHDNNTTRGWYDTLHESERHAVRVFLSANDQEVPRRMVEAVLASKAALAITPLQDIFELGADARMNDPSGAQRSWVWRMPPGLLDQDDDWQWFARLTHNTGRAPDPPLTD